MSKDVACLYASLRVRYCITAKTGNEPTLGLRRRYPSFVPHDGLSTSVAMGKRLIETVKSATK